MSSTFSKARRSSFVQVDDHSIRRSCHPTAPSFVTILAVSKPSTSAVAQPLTLSSVDYAPVLQKSINGIAATF